MGEWSEYFEDFPDENPANYVAGRFDPQAAHTQREAWRQGDSSSSD